MKKYKVCLFFLLMFIVTTSYISNRADSLYQVFNENMYCLNDTSLKKTISLHPKWFSSWPWEVERLNIDSFETSVDKREKEIFCNTYDPNNKYLRQFDTLLIHLGKLSIDLYSSSTLIEKENNNVFVEFSVDRKVYILDKQNELKCEIASTGTYETIEDAIWLNEHEIVLLGYIDEGNGCYIPFIWIINIETEKESIYKYINCFKGFRKNFFLIKYPGIRIRE